MAASTMKRYHEVMDGRCMRVVTKVTASFCGPLVLKDRDVGLPRPRQFSNATRACSALHQHHSHVDLWTDV